MKTNKPSKGGRPSKYKEISENIKIIAFLIFKGVENNKIAELLNISESTLYNYLRKCKVEIANEIDKEINKIKYRTPKKKKYNKENAKRYSKEYYKKNKEKFINTAIAREHKKKLLICDLTVEDWDNALKFFDNRCAYCGNEGKLHREHIIPMSKGGGYTRNNIIPSCIPCNQSKSNLMLEQWYKYSGVYSNTRLLKIIEWIYGKEARSEIEVRYKVS